MLLLGLFPRAYSQADQTHRPNPRPLMPEVAQISTPRRSPQQKQPDHVWSPQSTQTPLKRAVRHGGDMPDALQGGNATIYLFFPAWGGHAGLQFWWDTNYQ